MRARSRPRKPQEIAHVPTDASVSLPLRHTPEPLPQSIGQGPCRDEVQFALSVAALLGVAVSVIGVILAFLGSVVHRRWHSALSLDASMFPHPFDAAVVSGLYAVQTAVPLLPSILADLRPGAWVLVLLAVSALIAHVATRDRRSKRVTWLRRLLLVGGTATLAFFAFWIAVASMRAVAETGIQDLAAAAKSLRFVGGAKGGCPDGLSRRFRCVTVWKGDAMVASGILISTSQQHIVVIDPVVNAPRLLELSGLEIRGRAP